MYMSAASSSSSSLQTKPIDRDIYSDAVVEKFVLQKINGDLLRKVSELGFHPNFLSDLGVGSKVNYHDDHFKFQSYVQFETASSKATTYKRSSLLQWSVSDNIDGERLRKLGELKYHLKYLIDLELGVGSKGDFVDDHFELAQFIHNASASVLGTLAFCSGAPVADPSKSCSSRSGSIASSGSSRAKLVAQWDACDVGNWLRRLAYSEDVIVNFVRQKIDGDRLQKLGKLSSHPNYLIDLGVGGKGDFVDDHMELADYVRREAKTAAREASSTASSASAAEAPMAIGRVQPPLLLQQPPQSAAPATFATTGRASIASASGAPPSSGADAAPALATRAVLAPSPQPLPPQANGERRGLAAPDPDVAALQAENAAQKAEIAQLRIRLAVAAEGQQQRAAALAAALAAEQQQQRAAALAAENAGLQARLAQAAEEQQRRTTALAAENAGLQARLAQAVEGQRRAAALAAENAGLQARLAQAAEEQQRRAAALEAENAGLQARLA
eukprot:tig00000955_g5813.t1